MASISLSNPNIPTCVEERTASPWCLIEIVVAFAGPFSPIKYSNFSVILSGFVMLIKTPFSDSVMESQRA